MSWDIILYAERQKKGSDKWELIHPVYDPYGCIVRNYKWLIIGEVGDCNINDSLESYETIDIDELSDELKEEYKEETQGEYQYHQFYTVSIDDLRNKCNKVIEKYETWLECSLKALGINIDKDFDGEWNIIETEDNRNPNPLTYPISKELIAEWVRMKRIYEKALMNIGFCEAATGIAEYGDEIRFIMVGG